MNIELFNLIVFLVASVILLYSLSLRFTNIRYLLESENYLRGYGYRFMVVKEFTQYVPCIKDSRYVARGFVCRGTYLTGNMSERDAIALEYIVSGSNQQARNDVLGSYPISNVPPINSRLVRPSLA